jgi:hypothetical protein
MRDIHVAGTGMKPGRYLFYMEMDWIHGADPERYFCANCYGPEVLEFKKRKDLVDCKEDFIRSVCHSIVRGAEKNLNKDVEIT